MHFGREFVPTEFLDFLSKRVDIPVDSRCDEHLDAEGKKGPAGRPVRQQCVLPLRGRPLQGLTAAWPCALCQAAAGDEKKFKSIFTAWCAMMLCLGRGRRCQR